MEKRGEYFGVNLKNGGLPTKTKEVGLICLYKLRFLIHFVALAL